MDLSRTTTYLFDADLADRALAEAENIEQLEGLFFEAAETESKLPRAFDLRVKSNWPDYLPDPNESYGYNQVEVRPSPATSREVTRFDVAMDLLREIDAEDGRLIWAVSKSASRRARGPHWRALAKIMGVHPATVKRRFQAALWAVWHKMLYA